MSNQRQRAAGQSLVELALLTPLLFLLLLGVLECAFLIYTHVQVSNATREAARAASLYRSTRYPIDSNGKVVKCGGVEGWTLQQVVDQAIVRYATSAGCPQTSGTAASTALGLLETTPAAGWTATVTASLLANGMPEAGSTGTVELAYPHSLLIASALLPISGEPIWVEKSVSFQFQH